MTKQIERSFAFSEFVFYPDTGELARAGKSVRISTQEARLLSLLVENQGMMITREQLREALWPEGEILDFDASINRTVSQLRSILRDHSSKSKPMIETLPKRGYRFNAEVREIPRSEPAAPPSESSATELPLAAVAAVAQDPSQSLSDVAVHSGAVARKSKARIRLLAVAIGIVLVAATGVWIFQTRHSVAPHAISLGIVPFEASGTGATALAESFRLNLADVLSQSPEIETRAVHSFDHVGQDEGQILSRAQHLGVEALLFGKFDLSDNQCQLRLELVRSRDGVHLSSFQYSGTKEELAAISDRVERDIFERLHPDGKRMLISLGRPSSSSAYADYLRGRTYLQHWTDDDLLQAIASFGMALHEDPSYARADAGTASAYFVLSQHGGTDTNDRLEKARQFAARALALDPTLAEAHAMMGEVALVADWDFPRAEQELHRAVELDPDHAIYHQWLSILYSIEGKYSLSLSEIDKAHAADPDWAPLYMTEIFLAGSAGQFDRADRAADRLLSLMPNWPLAHEQHAMSLWAEGKSLEAIAEWRMAGVLEKNPERIRLEERGADAFRSGGVKAYARLRLEAIKTRRGITHEEQDFIPAEWHAYCGEWEQTIADLTNMVKTRSPNALQIASDPAYLPLHRDPRFLALLKQIQVPLPSDTLTAHL